jgi:hypothetical protein
MPFILIQSITICLKYHFFPVQGTCNLGYYRNKIQFLPTFSSLKFSKTEFSYLRPQASEIQRDALGHNYNLFFIRRDNWLL